MTVCRFCALALVFLQAALYADVTLRYKTETKMNPNLPAAMAAGMNGMGVATSQDSVIQLKGGKGLYTAAGFNSIVDFTTQEMTLLDATGGRYAKVTADQLGDALAGAMPKIPAEASAIMASMKTDVSPAKVTGRTAVIQGVEAEEREIVISIGGPAIPNMPAGPLVRMVMQMWTAKPGEVLRIPAIRELTGYSLWSYATMNPTAGIEGMMKLMPGLADTVTPLMKEMQKGTTILRTHVEMFMPMMAAMLKQMPAGANPTGGSLDPDAPLMQMNTEAVELSSATVPDSVFQIPEGYREAPASDVVKTMFAKFQPAVKQ
jgi:hypothetical protein